MLAPAGSSGSGHEPAEMPADRAAEGFSPRETRHNPSKSNDARTTMQLEESGVNHDAVHRVEAAASSPPTRPTKRSSPDAATADPGARQDD